MGQVKKSEEIKRYRLVVTKESQGCKVQHRNIVNNIVVTMCGARWVLELLEDHFVNYMVV